MQKMKELPFTFPPRAEQDQIVRFLNWKTSLVNQLIHINKKQIAELEAYKARLIFDVVTGKMDVHDIKIPAYEYIEEETDSVDNLEDATENTETN